jgi:hypothetical protein
MANPYQTTHGQSHTPEYNVWQMIKQRCYNKRAPNYKLYGGRGIKVDPCWINSFETFLADMGPRPAIRYTIERVNNNGDYSKSNCIWATRKTQGYNRNTNKLDLSTANLIRQLYATGHYTQIYLAEEFGVGEGTISEVITRKRWQ